MNRETDDPIDLFVPVSETLEGRVRKLRRGAPWPLRDVAWLVAITVAGAVLRFWHIELWSVSTAEAETWRHAIAPQRTSFDLFEWLLRMAFDSALLPSYGEGWLRLPFLFAGTLAIPLVVLVGDPLVGRRAAMLAAAMLALHPWHVEVCQTATGHGAALTCMLLTVGAAWLARGGRWFGWLLVAALAGLAGVCHPIGWLTVPLLFGCWQLEEWRGAEQRDRRNVWGRIVLAMAAMFGAVIWLRPDGKAGDPLGAVLSLGGAVMAAGIPLIALAVLAPFIAAGRLRRRRYVVLSAVIPLVVATALAASVITPAREHALPALPAFLLLAAVAALTCFDRVRTALGDGRGIGVWLPSAMVALVVLLDLTIGTFLYSTARRGSRPDWRTARDQIVATTRHSSLEVLAGSGHVPLLYYLRPDHWRQPVRPRSRQEGPQDPAANDPHPGIAVTAFDVARPRLADAVESAEALGTELFLALLEDELATVRRDPEARAVLAGFELIEVLPCAGTARDETIYVLMRKSAR